MRNVVITGASSGIGAATALALDREGVTVFAGTEGEDDGLAALASASPRLRRVTLDVTSEESIASAFERIAREVGGTDLGRLLRTLSAFLREDARTRGELQSRQGWTVNAARLALCAPWLLLLLLSLQPETVRAYNTTTGALVLLLGGGCSLGAYRLMLRIAKLPDERRVLR